MIKDHISRLKYDFYEKGVARGSGWQNIGAWANVVAYYLLGGPVGFFLGFWGHMNGKGLWIGVIVGSTAQGIILAIVTACLSWEEQVNSNLKYIFGHLMNLFFTPY
ncbi:hypothetical protein AtEden1_Chr2g0225131 [Arabidopsis thaliana]